MKLRLNSLRILAAIMLLCVSILAYTRGTAYAMCAAVVGGLFINQRRTAGACYAYLGAGLADIFIPAVYGAIQPKNRTDLTAFVESGVAVTNPLLTSAANSGTKTVEIPLWGDIDPTVEPNLSDATDTEATPGKVSAESYKARNAYLNKGMGAADLAVEMSGATPGQGSPMTRIKERFGVYWMRQFQARILAACKGIMAKNIATNSGDMVYSIAAEATGSVTDATRFSADALVEACFTMGDQFNGLLAIALHSAIYKKMVKQQLIEQQKDADGKLLYETYLGRRVIVDDGMPVRAGTTSGLVYTSILFGAGAIGYGEGSPLVPAEVDRIPAGGNGAGLENIWERKTWMIHPNGWNWTDSSVAAQSATPAELATAANWTRVLYRKQCQMAFLLTNA